MDNLTLIISLFGAGALAGVYLLALVLQDKETPKAITMVHGLFVVLAFVLLIVYAFRHNPAPVESIALFLLAAAGGLVLVYKDLTGRKIPRWLAIGHGILAASGFIFLIVFSLS